MSIEKIDQYIKELTAIKHYDRIKQQLAEKEKESENLENTLSIKRSRTTKYKTRIIKMESICNRIKRSKKHS